MTRPNNRPKIRGQGILDFGLTPERVNYDGVSRFLEGIISLINQGSEGALIFPSASAKRIAISQRGRYGDYLRGARENVTRSPEYIVGSIGRADITEFRQQKGKIGAKLNAASGNARQTLIRTIAQNYRETNIANLADPYGERQSIEARLRAARKDGLLGHFSFTNEIRADVKNDGTPGVHQSQLLELARGIDRELETEGGNPFIESTFDSALKVPPETMDSDAAIFIHKLGHLWVVNTKAVHEHWVMALESYNGEFSDAQIDPDHPSLVIASSE